MEEGLKATFVQIPHKSLSGTVYTNLFSIAKACHVNPTHLPLQIYQETSTQKGNAVVKQCSANEQHQRQ